MTPAIQVTPYSIAARFLGLREVAGHIHNAQIVGMMQCVDPSVHDDETPWCSGFVNYCCFLLGVTRSRSLAARSWLRVGAPITLDEASAGFDIVVLSRGDNPAPASVVAAPGHVGFFSNYRASAQQVTVLGGNQGDAVSLVSYPTSRVLGIRRLV